jgi:hypothetical protein
MTAERWANDWKLVVNIGPGLKEADIEGLK